jgi:hypothetical protein
VRRLRSLEPGSDAEKFTAVAARQGRNLVSHAIAQAIELRDARLAKLG